jgi:hypothetical protein
MLGVTRHGGSAQYAGVSSSPFGDRHIRDGHTRMPHIFHGRPGHAKRAPNLEVPNAALHLTPADPRSRIRPNRDRPSSTRATPAQPTSMSSSRNPAASRRAYRSRIAPHSRNRGSHGSAALRLRLPRSARQVEHGPPSRPRSRFVSTPANQNQKSISLIDSLATSGPECHRSVPERSPAGGCHPGRKIHSRFPVLTVPPWRQALGPPLRPREHRSYRPTR